MMHPRHLLSLKSHPEWLLYAGGFLLLACAVNQRARLDAFQSQSLNHAESEVRSEGTSSGLASLPGKNHPRVLGTISVSRIGLRSAMLEGTTDDNLALGVGHVTGTAGFGQNGNIILAGHRDTVFWPLRRLVTGDRIEVHAGRRFVFQVDSMHIVEPTDTALLGASSRPLLTIVTCWPFSHIGPAPKRLVIQARLVSTS